MTEQSEKRQQQDQTYVVQIQRMLVDAARDGSGDVEIGVVAWEDLATITVPPRTKRSFVIKKALGQAGIRPSGEQLKVRVLDVDSFEVHEPKVRQVEPEWVID